MSTSKTHRGSCPGRPPVLGEHARSNPTAEIEARMSSIDVCGTRMMVPVGAWDFGDMMALRKILHELGFEVVRPVRSSVGVSPAFRIRRIHSNRPEGI